MKKILLALLCVLTEGAVAQQSIIAAPRDARNNMLPLALGNPYAVTLTTSSASYDVSVRYQVPSSGNDAQRAFRTVAVVNPSATRIAYFCFGNSSGCSTDSIIVRPGYAIVFEPLLFGKAVADNKEYIYMRADSAAALTADLMVW